MRYFILGIAVGILLLGIRIQYFKSQVDNSQEILSNTQTNKTEIQDPIVVWKHPETPFVDSSSWKFQKIESNRSQYKRESICLVTSLSLHYKRNKFKSAKEVNEEQNWTKKQSFVKGKYFNESRELGRLSIENKLSYAHIHHYPFFFYHAHLIDPNRSPTWSKIPVVQNYLDDFEWVMWLDIDAIIMNHTIVIEDIIKRAEELKSSGQSIDLIIGKDGNGLNNGVFLIRSCLWAKNFLQEVWDSYDTKLMKTALFHEQSAMEKLLEQRVHLKHTIFVPLRWFNSFSDRVVDAFINEMTPKELAILRYQPGDFILHTPGLHDKEKLIEITKVMNNTYPDIHLIPEPAINWKIQLQDYEFNNEEGK